MKKAPQKSTPIRLALVKDSALQPSVTDGLGAIAAAHRNHFESSIRSNFSDSLNLDEAVMQGREEENRWDYLLGHEPSGEVIAVEPHSAKHSEINTVIRKRAAARRHLREHLCDGASVQRWLWVASGKVHFADTEKTKRLLDQHGIEFVGAKIMTRHLPPATISSTPPTGNGNRKRKR
jgi:hypothetical protein